MPKPGGPSPFKQEVLDLYSKGFTVVRVKEIHPEIPIGTLKTWRHEFNKATGKTAELAKPKTQGFTPQNQDGDRDSSPVHSVDCEVVTDFRQEKVVALPTGSESDFALVRKQMRAALRDPNAKIHEKAMAARLLLQAVEMRATLPAAVLDEVQEKTLQHELREAEKRSPEESARRFKDLLDQIG